MRGFDCTQLCKWAPHRLTCLRYISDPIIIIHVALLPNLTSLQLFSACTVHFNSYIQNHKFSAESPASTNLRITESSMFTALTMHLLWHKQIVFSIEALHSSKRRRGAIITVGQAGSSPLSQTFPPLAPPPWAESFYSVYGEGPNFAPSKTIPATVPPHAPPPFQKSSYAILSRLRIISSNRSSSKAVKSMKHSYTSFCISTALSTIIFLSDKNIILHNAPFWLI